MLPTCCVLQLHDVSCIFVRMMVSIAGEEVVKSAHGAADRHDLAREARILRSFAHPGVVRLVRVEGGDPPERLILRRVRGSTLSELGSEPAEVTAGWTAAVATVLADLHDVGLCHGAINGDHVLFDAGGRPVLCGFGSAHPVEGPTDCLADVAALARMALERLPPGAERRLVRLLSSSARSGHRRLTAGHPLSARHLAATLVAAVPQARLAGGDRDDPSPRLAGGDPDERGGDPAAGAAEAGPPCVGGMPGDSRMPRRKWVLLASTSLAVAGCAAAVIIANLGGGAQPVARTLDTGTEMAPPRGGGGEYELRLPVAEDPLTVIGRWDCGVARPAVLDLRSGTIWIFPDWPEPGGAERGVVAGRVPDATGLAVRAVEPGCDVLEALRGGGPPVAIGGMGR